MGKATLASVLGLVPLSPDLKCFSCVGKILGSATRAAEAADDGILTLTGMYSAATLLETGALGSEKRN